MASAMSRSLRSPRVMIALGMILAIACCAADAYPVKVRLRGHDLSAYQDDSWVHLVATVIPDSATKANEYVPTATVHSVTPTTEPEDPYEH